MQNTVYDLRRMFRRATAKLQGVSPSDVPVPSGDTFDEVQQVLTSESHTIGALSEFGEISDLIVTAVLQHRQKLDEAEMWDEAEMTMECLVAFHSFVCETLRTQGTLDE